MNPAWLAIRVAALIGVPLLHLANRRSVQRTSAAVEAVSVCFPVTLSSPALVVAAASGAAARMRLGSTSCIARSQFAYLLVGGHKRGASVPFGTQPDLGSTGEAHAWLEVDGKPIGEAENVATVYLQFDRPLLPPS